MNQLKPTPKVDANEAPAGFYAVAKPQNATANICRLCDWRAQCNDETTDFLAYGHRCMGYAVVSAKDGKTYQRNDGCSVIFKKQ